MKSIIFSSVASFLVPLVSAHAHICEPTPLGFGTLIPADNSYNSPLKADGSDFPCKGMIGKADMKPVVEWTAGEQAFFQIQPNDAPPPQEGKLAAHSGGSCQVSLSFDNGCTWKVLHSYVGGCPRNTPLNSNLAGPNQTFAFDIPAETKGGQAIFSWSWIARTGNRGEFYMNCASVKIKGQGSSTLSDRPDMWLGEMATGPITKQMCQSKAGFNFQYPNPGPPNAVTVANEDSSKPEPPFNSDGTTDFSKCKAPCNKSPPPTQQPPSSPPPAVHPSYTTTTVQPPPTKPPVQPPTQTKPPAGQFELTLDNVVYECKPKGSNSKYN